MEQLVSQTNTDLHACRVTHITPPTLADSLSQTHSYVQDEGRLSGSVCLEGRPRLRSLQAGVKKPISVKPSAGEKRKQQTSSLFSSSSCPARPGL